jgi:type IV pilus assembly protein PilY1
MNARGRRYFLLPLQLLALAFSAQAATNFPTQTPLFVNSAVPPLNMLVVERDHKLYAPAYNDAADLDGDGVLDIYYKPAVIDYTGYFDSGKCYSYDTANGYFVPQEPGTAIAGTPTTGTPKKCGTGNSDAPWSGDFLNYLTTSRMDALRKVLYGGYRSTDTATSTVLARGNVPADAHSWGKEYRSNTRDGYNISDYAPISTPSDGAGSYALFANTTYNNQPSLRVIPSTTDIRIWGWVSRESVQGQDTATTTAFRDVGLSGTTPSGTLTSASGRNVYSFNVRVQACVSGLLESNCKAYPNGQYKPTGLLHDYGEGNQMYFGLLTGTYNDNLQGGVLRKAISSFANEVDANTGIFGVASTSGRTTTYTKQGIIATLDGIQYSQDNACSGWGSPGNDLANGKCYNYGNPLAEMSYEVLRYFSGATTPTSGYAAGSVDSGLGLPSVTSWSNPYSTYPSCSKPFQTLLSDVNPSYDSDLPDSAFTATSVPETLTDFSVRSLGQTIWNNEVGGSRSINIGEVAGSTSDYAPTAKAVNGFGLFRGLPDEPTRQGTYNIASVAYYGNKTALTTSGQRLKTFAVALSSTQPRIQMTTSRGTLTLVPFGKVTSQGSTYQATEQITGFYVDTMANLSGMPVDSTKNNGRPLISFRVVYDDAAQGGDYDMDAIVLYTLAANADGTVTVTSDTQYSVSGNDSHMGYTMSGTNADGIYLEVTGGGTSSNSGSLHNPLDTPPGKLPGACVSNANACPALPGRKSNSVVVNGGSSTTRTFTPSSSSLVTNLQNPLWYAAKWGGFNYSSSSPLPVAGDWDSNKSGTPDNYFLVTNASTLKTQLSNAFNQILQSNNSVSAPAVLPYQSTSSGTATRYDTYTTSMNASYWSGDLTKSTIEVTPSSSGTATKTTTQVWKASAQLPGWGSRVIKMAAVPGAGSGLQDFTYAALARRTYGGTSLQSNLDANKVNFLKGDNSLATSTYRQRSSPLGDIINSAPALANGAQYLTSAANALESGGDYGTFKTNQAAEAPMVYVGANDGMLHGFNATTGQEAFAFVPTAVIPNLYLLAKPNYNNATASQHTYYVDGSPVIADVYFGSAWHKVLIGTLRGGGRSLFALDITDPDAIKLLWEFNGEASNAGGNTQTEPTLGYSFGTPLVSRLHTGQWAVLAGNGYNGNGGTASLLILDIATGKLLKKLDAETATQSNGLFNLKVLDVNSDGVADYVYGGDLKGNLWRFDLLNNGNLTATATVDNFTVAFGGKPLYTARSSDTNGVIQPITAPPSVVKHPSGTGFIVMFGTGSYFATEDKTSTSLQSVYGIWDKNVSTASTPNTVTSLTTLQRSNLQRQTITSESTVSGKSARVLSNTAVNWTTVSGWYLDLQSNNQALGERVVDPMTASGQTLVFNTLTPNADVCSSGVTGWAYAVDPASGGRTSFNVFDLNGDGVVNSLDSLNGTVVSGFGTIAGGTTLASNQLVTTDGISTTVNKGSQMSGRQTWRVIPQPQ